MYLSLNLTVEEVLKAGEDEIVSQEIVELIVKVEEHLKSRVEESLTSLREIGDVWIRKFAEESREVFHEELLYFKDEGSTEGEAHRERVSDEEALREETRQREAEERQRALERLKAEHTKRAEETHDEMERLQREYTAKVERLRREQETAEKSMKEVEQSLREERKEGSAKWVPSESSLGKKCSIAVRDRPSQSGEEHGTEETAFRVKGFFYMDDYSYSHDSEEDAIRISIGLVNALKEGNFNLKKWSSNSANILNVVGGANLTERIIGEEEAKVLGLRWNTKKDTLDCTLKNFSEQNTAFTRGAF
ncbi:Hypothetical protein FKW44_014154 [Caligus rogercresseyi]|uniref:Uncharacterized protein n=1 Tax=Caligus rogercresseyi TaxID=217165 RepID=A0A7T8GYG8_CALRO|nr:Hypothetical protein FKW44_014154 [Caligus rogercresseyi]